MKVEIYKALVELEQGEYDAEDALIGILDILKEKKKTDPKVYTGQGMLVCKLGLYEVTWLDGGKSVAAIGMDSQGKRWFAPTNWVSTGMLEKHLDQIDCITLLYVQNDEND